MWLVLLLKVQPVWTTLYNSFISRDTREIWYSIMFSVFRLFLQSFIFCEKVDVNVALKYSTWVNVFSYSPPLYVRFVYMKIQPAHYSPSKAKWRQSSFCSHKAQTRGNRPFSSKHVWNGGNDGSARESKHNRNITRFGTSIRFTSAPSMCELSKMRGRQQVRRPLLTASLSTPSFPVGLHCTWRTPTLSSQGSEELKGITAILLGNT